MLTWAFCRMLATTATRFRESCIFLMYGSNSNGVWWPSDKARRSKYTSVCSNWAADATLKLKFCHVNCQKSNLRIGIRSEDEAESDSAWKIREYCDLSTKYEIQEEYCYMNEPHFLQKLATNCYKVAVWHQAFKILSQKL